MTIANGRRTTRRDAAAPAGQSAPLRPQGKPVIHVISDSTGNLAHHILAALLTQFPPDAFEVRFWTFVRTPEQLSTTLDQILRQPG
ncbi:MAG TPA: kinase/pyrophosphorylase, partial [Tepidisphaeraceae bacterium]|nr:kinase/pyrophosphorylase [Tepidisphaeraceae bacterium]